MKNRISRTKLWLGLAFATVGLSVAGMPGLAKGQAGRVSWDKVSTWAIQTGEMPATIQEIADSPVDLGVISSKKASGEFWTKAEVAQVKRNKWVLSYLSVGEADPQDYYWQKNWKPGSPTWLVNGNPNGHDGFAIYPIDQPEWVKIVKQQLDRLVAAGYDGALFDVLDGYWNPGYPGGPNAENMKTAIRFTCQLTDYVRRRKPDFKIMINNATNLMHDFPELNFGRCFDSTMMESLWYYSTDNAQAPIFYNYHIGFLQKQLKDGKKIFVLDKATLPENVQRAYTENKKLGFIPFATDYAVSKPFPKTLK